MNVSGLTYKEFENQYPRKAKQFKRICTILKISCKDNFFVASTALLAIREIFDNKDINTYQARKLMRMLAKSNQVK